MSEFRGLSLWQPWASLVAYGAKRWETRSWATKYRGAIAIHAARRRTPPIDEPRFIEEAIQVLGHADFNALPGGKIVAVCEVAGCYRINSTEEWTKYLSMTYRGDLSGGYRELKFGDWSPGRFVWKLEHVRRLVEPIPTRGYQSLWALDQDVIDQIAVGLARSVAV